MSAQLSWVMKTRELEAEIARLRNELKLAIADKLIDNMKAVETEQKLRAALEQILELGTLKDGKLSYTGKIARKVLANEQSPHHPNVADRLSIKSDGPTIDTGDVDMKMSGPLKRR